MTNITNFINMRINTLIFYVSTFRLIYIRNKRLFVSTFRLINIRNTRLFYFTMQNNLYFYSNSLRSTLALFKTVSGFFVTFFGFLFLIFVLNIIIEGAVLYYIDEDQLLQGLYMSLSLVGVKPAYNINNVFNYLNLSKFHTSNCIFSKDDKDLEERIKNLSIEKEVNLSTEEYDEMKKGLLDFKNEVLNVSEKDVKDEFNSVMGYLDSTESQISSTEEAFPDYMKKIEEKDMTKVEGEDLLNDKSVFNIVKELKEVLEKCKSSDNSDECIKQLILTKVINNVLTNNTPEDINSKVKGAYFEEILKTVGNITLLELYEKIKEIDSKLDLKLIWNYKELGLSLVSYGLIMRSFNKYVYKRPIPKILQGEDLKTILRARYVGRIIFGTIMAPFVIISMNGLKGLNLLSDVNVNLTKNNETDNNLNKSSTIVFLAIIKGLKGVNKWVKLFLGIIIIVSLIMLWYAYGDILTNINFYKNWIYKNFYPYYILILLILIFIPIIVNAIFLFMLYKVESKGYISIPKFSPNILKRFINFLKKTNKNKELLNYYKGQSWAELKFYVVILVIVLCVISYYSINITISFN